MSMSTIILIEFAIECSMYMPNSPLLRLSKKQLRMKNVSWKTATQNLVKKCRTI